MRPIYRVFAAAVILTSSGAAGVLAQPMGPGMMQGGGIAHAGFTGSAAYLDSLKAELGITSEQAAAWDSYADTVKSASAQIQAMHQSMYESMGTMSWPERRDLMNTMFESRQNSFQIVHEAAEKLTASLDDTQKTKAASLLPGLAYGGPGMYRGGMMQGGPRMGGPGRLQ